MYISIGKHSRKNYRPNTEIPDFHNLPLFLEKCTKRSLQIACNEIARPNTQYFSSPKFFCPIFLQLHDAALATSTTEADTSKNPRPGRIP
jgi:hypothetical protein